MDNLAIIIDDAISKGYQNKVEGILSNIPTGISSELTGGPNTGLLDLAQSFMSN